MIRDFIEALELKDDKNVNFVLFDSKLQNLMFPGPQRPNYADEADRKCYGRISVGRMTEK